MIAQLTGTLVAKSPAGCVLDVGGVGFALVMSASSISHLPATGDQVTIFTHLHVREDELSLFGFESTLEREVFEKLITVSGVGPKVALSALSALAPSDLAAAIAREDDALIATVPGIGKKTAQRLIVELKDTFSATSSAGSAAPRGGDGRAEAADALASMGFSPAEVATALKGFDGPDESQALLRYALKRLGGGR